MSWRDRPYSDEDSYGGGFGRAPELRLQFPKPSSLTAWLLIANVAVFLVQAIAGSFWIDRTFGLSLYGITHGMIWQIVSYMFLHADFWHLFFNMIMLYFVGTTIERGFGRDRFLMLYGFCGVFGGLVYLAFSAVSTSHYGVPLVGASGAIWGLLMVAMIFYPAMQVILYFFPVPIRVFGAIMLGIFLFQILTGQYENPGGQMCHLGGAAAAIGLLSVWGVMPRVRVGGFAFGGSGYGTPSRLSRWLKQFSSSARRARRLQNTEAEVDRILEKVHREGVHSLTRRERNLLTEATRLQRDRDRELANRGRY